MEQQKIEFQRYRDFGQIINATFEFIKLNFLPLLKSLIFIAGPFLLITGILTGFYQKSIFSLYNITSFTQMGVVFLLLMISAFLTIQMMIVSVYSFLLIYLSRSEMLPIQIEEVWDGVKQNFFKILGLTLTISALLGIAILIFALIIGLMIGASNNPFLILLFFIIFFIPIMFFSVKISLVYMIALYEKKGIWQSIQRSFYLTQNKWWFTLGLIIVLGIIEGLMGFVFQIPQYIVMFVTMFNSMDGSGVDGVMEMVIMFTSILSMFQYILYTITIIALAFHYFSLVEQKEAKGLLEKIESIQ